MVKEQTGDLNSRSARQSSCHIIPFTVGHQKLKKKDCGNRIIYNGDIVACRCYGLFCVILLEYGSKRPNCSIRIKPEQISLNTSPPTHVKWRIISKLLEMHSERRSRVEQKAWRRSM
ncbi:hypothetical protein CHS0354_028611 [Potamilus streckersoni]|uniref:Uncharacterized protein n=1 Tax=Potamilus streckersoni TaxID=2493646 RepID=A0AAE0RUW1_9BIVA|nr:hypothetical protein CHS0354_028611 [Potamilus streckersoni]